MRRIRSAMVAACVLALVLPVPAAAAQIGPAASPPQPTPQREVPADPLGRTTPRGTLQGFLNAARKTQTEVARQYLDTRLRDKAAEDLARQLFAVLDARLPARLTHVSDAPEGSRANPLVPDRDIVGTIQGDAGPVDIVLERVERPKSGPVWLFSSETLAAVPHLYEELARSRAEGILPRFLRSTRIRTLDRAIVSVPNSQIASATIETLPARDKYWFHPVVPLQHDTTPEQLHAVLDGVRQLLVAHPAIDAESVHVRLLRLGAFSLDVDLFAYVRARDWEHFLETQEQLLFRVTDIVHAAGTAVALPSQTMYVAGPREALPGRGVIPMR